MRRIARSRKGQAEEDDETFPWLTAAAIAVMVLLLIMLLYQKIYVGTAGSPEEAQCRASIVTQAKIVYASGGDLSSQIVCTPKQVTISTENEENAKRQLAETMKSCWDRWQRGTLELFKDNGIYCNPCAYVSFNGGGKTLQGFSQYLTTATISKDGPTYASYLMSTGSGQAKGNVPMTSTPPSVAEDTLLTGTEYAVLFLYAKGDSVQRIKNNFGSNPVRNVKKVAVMTGVGAVVGGVTIVVATGGIALVPIVIAGVAGGAIGGIGEYLVGSSEKPEWVSLVVLEPNDANTLLGLGCQKVEQQGPSQLKTKDV
jgi:hypothetical protein